MSFGLFSFTVDKLITLHDAERLNLIAVTGGFFKLQIRGGSLHFVLQGARQFVGFAIKESRSFTHAVTIIFFADVTDTRRGTAFDLVQQTRTVAMLEYTVFAGT